MKRVAQPRSFRKWMTRRRKALPGPETALSRRFLRVLEKWVPVGTHYFSDWPRRRNCGHFLGGCHWYGLESIAGALTFAAVASSPEYDEQTGQCSRSDLKKMALKAVRYLCFTHDSGPADCVRPERGLGCPANFGTKWGERDKGFFPASQCGTTIAGLAVTALLLGDVVDEETWAMIAAVHADYAVRFGKMPPKSGVYLDTQMEENGWTSCGLASVERLLKNAPDSAEWAAMARRWMFSTATAPQDAKDGRVFADGLTVARLTGKTLTALPDYMAENHGMVHPSYTSSGIAFTGILSVIYGVYGTGIPKHALFNRRKIYDRLKPTADDTGSLLAVQGMDWPYLFADPGTMTHAVASVLLKDPDAAALERRALTTLEGRQDSNGGRMYNSTIGELCHDIQDPMIVRECCIQRPAYTYLLHRLHGDGPEPTRRGELNRKLHGVKVYPHAGFVLHRHARGQTSVAWRNCQMALPLTTDGIQTVAPASGSWFGRVEVSGRPDSQNEISVNVDAHHDGFAAALVMERAQGAVRQEILFAGLPDGTSLSFERWVAQEKATVNEAELGFLRIINERFDAIRGNCNGFRVFHTPRESIRFDGYVSADENSDIVRIYDCPGWVNIDGRLGIVFKGTGKTVYCNRHYFKTWWATADDLILGRLRRPKRVRSGEVFAQLTAMLMPGESPAGTAGERLTALSGKGRCTGLIGHGHMAAANFEQKPVSTILRAQRSRLENVPVFEGTTRITGRKIAYYITLQPGQAVLKKAVAHLSVTGDVEVTASAASGLFAANTGKGPARIKTAGGSVKLRPGEITQNPV